MSLLPGMPDLKDAIPNPESVASMLAIPKIASILNVPNIPSLQAIPSVLSIIKAPSINAIATLPGVTALLNVPSLSSLVRLPNISNLLNLGKLPLGLFNKDGPNLPGASTLPVWGIFTRQGKLLVKADSVLSLEFKNSWNISKFPQEEGAFQSYNKVNSPYQARIQLSKGGTETDRSNFLQAIDDAANSLDLYNIHMPEKFYVNANIYDYSLVRRANNGVGLITVEIWLEEVRITTTTQFSNSTGQVVSGPVAGNLNIPQAISAFSPVNLGNLQSMIPSAKQLTNFALDKVIGNNPIRGLIG